MKRLVLLAALLAVLIPLATPFPSLGRKPTPEEQLEEFLEERDEFDLQEIEAHVAAMLVEEELQEQVMEMKRELYDTIGQEEYEMLNLLGRHRANNDEPQSQQGLLLRVLLQHSPVRSLLELKVSISTSHMNPMRQVIESILSSSPGITSDQLLLHAYLRAARSTRSPLQELMNLKEEAKTGPQMLNEMEAMMNLMLAGLNGEHKELMARAVEQISTMQMLLQLRADSMLITMPKLVKYEQNQGLSEFEKKMIRSMMNSAHVGDEMIMRQALEDLLSGRSGLRPEHMFVLASLHQSMESTSLMREVLRSQDTPLTPAEEVAKRTKRDVGSQSEMSPVEKMFYDMSNGQTDMADLMTATMMRRYPVLARFSQSASHLEQLLVQQLTNQMRRLSVEEMLFMQSHFESVERSLRNIRLLLLMNLSPVNLPSDVTRRSLGLAVYKQMVEDRNMRWMRDQAMLLERYASGQATIGQTVAEWKRLDYRVGYMPNIENLMRDEMLVERLHDNTTGNSTIIKHLIGGMKELVRDFKISYLLNNATMDEIWLLYRLHYNKSYSDLEIRQILERRRTFSSSVLKLIANRRSSTPGKLELELLTDDVANLKEMVARAEKAAAA